MTASTGGRDGRAQDAEQRNCSSNTDEDELELECSTNYRDPAIHLTRDQLGKPTAELFEAKHLENPQDKSDIANFTGKWGHVRARALVSRLASPRSRAPAHISLAFPSPLRRSVCSFGRSSTTRITRSPASAASSCRTA